MAKLSGAFGLLLVPLVVSMHSLDVHNPNLMHTQSTATASIDISRLSGLPRTPLILHGTGFPPSEVVAIYIDQPNPYWYLARPPGPTADARGEFTVSLMWPGPNYDISKRVDPTKPGVHLVCGDTGYPGSSPPILARACTQFTVPGPSPVAATGADQLPSLPLPLIAAAIVIVLVLGVAGQWWMQRQSKR